MTKPMRTDTAESSHQGSKQPDAEQPPPVIVIKKKKKPKKVVQQPEPSPSEPLLGREDQDNAGATQSVENNYSSPIEEHQPWATSERGEAYENAPGYQVPDSDEFRNVWDGDK